MNSPNLLKFAKGDVQRKDKGRKKPQAIRQAKAKTKALIKHLHSQSQSANNYLTKQMSDKKNKTVYTIADDKQVQVLYPKGGSKTYKQLPRDEDPEFWDELTDEEIDELFG